MDPINKGFLITATERMLKFRNTYREDEVWLNRDSKINNHLVHIVKVAIVEVGSAVIASAALVQSVVCSYMQILYYPFKSFVPLYDYMAEVVDSSSFAFQWNLGNLLLNPFCTNLVTDESLSRFEADYRPSGKIQKILAITVVAFGVLFFSLNFWNAGLLPATVIAMAGVYPYPILFFKNLNSPKMRWQDGIYLEDWSKRIGRDLIRAKFPKVLVDQMERERNKETDRKILDKFWPQLGKVVNKQQLVVIIWKEVFELQATVSALLAGVLVEVMAIYSGNGQVGPQVGLNARYALFQEKMRELLLRRNEIASAEGDLSHEEGTLASIKREIPNLDERLGQHGQIDNSRKNSILQLIELERKLGENLLFANRANLLIGRLIGEARSREDCSNIFGSYIFGANGGVGIDQVTRTNATHGDPAALLFVFSHIVYVYCFLESNASLEVFKQPLREIIEGIRRRVREGTLPNRGGLEDCMHNIDNFNSALRRQDLPLLNEIIPAVNTEMLGDSFFICCYVLALERYFLLNHS